MNELRSILEQELGPDEASAVSAVLDRHRERTHAAAAQATRNLSVRVAEARSHTQVRPFGRMLAAGLVTAAIAAVMILRTGTPWSSEPTTSVASSTPVASAPPAASVANEPQRVVPLSPDVPGVERTRNSVRASRSAGLTVADLTVVEEDILVETLAASVRPADGWVVSDSDIDILLGENNHGL